MKRYESALFTRGAAPQRGRLPTLRRGAVCLGFALVGGCFVEPEEGSWHGSESGSGDGAVSATSNGQGPVGTSDTAPTSWSAGEGDSTGGFTTTGSSLTGELLETSTSSSGAEEASTDFGDTSESGDRMIVPLDAVQRGDLIISEIMWNPACPADNCEWLELYNTTDQPISIQSLVVEDYNGYQGIVSDAVIIESHDFAVLVRTHSDWPYAFDYDAVFGPTPSLNNDIERVSIRNQAIELDRTPVFSLGQQGSSWGLHPEFMSEQGNDLHANWCLSATELPSEVGTEYGTPHAPTGECQPEP